MVFYKIILKGGVKVQLKTKYFGTVDYEQQDIINFPDGLYGFDDEKQFLLLPFEGSDATLLCFQSVSTPALAFVAMNPFSLNPSYTPILAPEELEKMGVTRSEDVCYYVMCVVRDPVSTSTVNLKCPVVVNDITQTGMQVILETKEYNMRHLLEEFNKAAAPEADCTSAQGEDGG